MLWRQLTAVWISGKGVQFVSFLGFENVDAHYSSFRAGSNGKETVRRAADRKAAVDGSV
jgi:hypothetical protein